MANVKFKDRSHIKDRVRSVNTREVIKYITLTVILCALSVMQTSFAKIGDIPSFESIIG